MPRPKGSRNRPKGDSCTALRQLLREKKEELAKAIGCEWCPRGEVIHDPDKLDWHAHDGAMLGVPLSQAPSLAGMTRARLLEEITHHGLVCGSCLPRGTTKEGMRELMKQSRKPVRLNLDAMLREQAIRQINEFLERKGLPTHITFGRVRYERTYEEVEPALKR